MPRRRRNRSPSAEHEYRRGVLDALAILTGHTAELVSGLPDGTRPDVARLDVKGMRVFLGEAKATETARCQATLARALKYVRWLAGGVRAGYSGTFGVCFGQSAHAGAWRNTIEMLILECGINGSCAVFGLATDVWLVWVRIEAPAAKVMSNEE
jgi:hypothetical protein